MTVVNIFKRTSSSALAHISQDSLSLSVKLSFLLLPRLAKIAAYILVILNLRSLPFGWHSMSLVYHSSCSLTLLVKLLWTVFRLELYAWCVRMRTLSLSSATRSAAACKYLDSLSPIGQNPLDKVIVLKCWAGPLRPIHLWTSP
jgi:hypothetical protein